MCNDFLVHVFVGKNQNQKSFLQLKTFLRHEGMIGHVFSTCILIETQNQ